MPRAQLLQPARLARSSRHAPLSVRAAGENEGHVEGMDQSKTSDRGQGDSGPGIISGTVAKGLQGVRELGKQVSIVCLFIARKAWRVESD